MGLQARSVARCDTTLVSRVRRMFGLVGLAVSSAALRCVVLLSWGCLSVVMVGVGTPS